MSIGDPRPAKSEGILAGVLRWLRDSGGYTAPMVSAGFGGGNIRSARFRGAKMRLKMQRPWVDGPKRR